MEQERTYFVVSRLSQKDRLALAEEINDSAVLDELSYDQNPGIRLAVAKNFCSLASTLDRLRRDDNKEVRKMAERTLDILSCG